MAVAAIFCGIMSENRRTWRVDAHTALKDNQQHHAYKDCDHESVHASNVTSGGQVRQVGLCSCCNRILRRSSPLHPWVLVDV